MFASWLVERRPAGARSTDRASHAQAVANLSDRHNVLVKFVGYTDDAPLTERNERIYMNHAGLSRAQARRVGWG